MMNNFGTETNDSEKKKTDVEPRLQAISTLTYMADRKESPGKSLKPSQNETGRGKRKAQARPLGHR